MSASAISSCYARAVIAPPSRPEAASLLADVIGEWRPDGEKGACRVARFIEEDLIAGAWPRDRSCGSEQALAESFGVGRAVIREAARILEVRGTARMVPGPGGGLRPMDVDPRSVVDFLVGFALFCNTTDTQLREAEEGLARARASCWNGAGAATGAEQHAAATLELLEEVLVALRPLIGRAALGSHWPSVLMAPDRLRQSRAGQIAGRILRECTVDEWREGHRLGSEEDICSRYGVDRDAVRQAVRILESSGAAQAICGRGRGLVSKAPRSGAIARLVSCLFASMGTAPDAVMTVFLRLNVEIIALAARKATPEDCDLLEHALGRLSDALDRQDTATVLTRVFDAEEAILAGCANPLLVLLAQSLRGYPTARIARDSRRLSGRNRRFLQLSLPILQALRTNDVGAAVTAEVARSIGLATHDADIVLPDSFGSRAH